VNFYTFCGCWEVIYITINAYFIIPCRRLVATLKTNYHIVGFYHEDFNIAFGNIKIHVSFVKCNILCKCPTVIPGIILQAILYRFTIDLLGFINLWIPYQLHVRKVTARLRRCPYLSIHIVAITTNTGRNNQLHPTVMERQ